MEEYVYIVFVMPNSIFNRAVVAVIVWYLHLPLHVQSVPITTNVASSNPVHGDMYSIQHNVIQFVSDLRKIGGFIRLLRFLPIIKLTTTI